MIQDRIKAALDRVLTRGRSRGRAYLDCLRNCDIELRKEFPEGSAALVPAIGLSDMARALGYRKVEAGKMVLDVEDVKLLLERYSFAGWGGSPDGRKTLARETYLRVHRLVKEWDEERAKALVGTSGTIIVDDPLNPSRDERDDQREGS